MSDPFFEVKKEKLYTASGLPTNKVALVSDEDSVLGVVSDNYNLVMNNEVFDFFNTMLSKEDYQIEKIVHNLDGTKKRWKCQVVFNDDRLAFPFIGDDIIGVLLEIWNGYSGKVSFGYSLMGYRFFCENGMVTGKKMILGESFTHLSNNQHDFLDSFQLKFDSLRTISDTWKSWNEIPFGFETYNKFIDYHTVDKKSKKKEDHRYLPESTSKMLIDNYEPVLNKLNLDDNMWGSFNVLTYLMTHGVNATKSDPVFTNKYKHISKLSNDFYDVDFEVLS